MDTMTLSPSNMGMARISSAEVSSERLTQQRKRVVEEIVGGGVQTSANSLAIAITI